MEYLQHFGLDQEPFGNDPLPDFYFESPQHIAAERRAVRGPLQGKGLTLLIGNLGSGKTHILRRLVEALPDDRFEPAVLVLARRNVDPTLFLQRFARQFGVEDPSDDRPTLIGQLAGRLVEIQERGRNAVAVIDEAQMLVGCEVMEELRGLLNMEGEKGRLISLVLCGLPDLEQMIVQYPPLAERVDIKVHLAPMDSESAAAYVAARIARAGGKPEIFTPAAMSTLGDMGRGLPRMLNTLADNALFEAFLTGRCTVSAEDVERAAWDLGVPGADEGVLAPPVEMAEPIVGPVDVDESQYATTIPEMVPLTEDSESRR